jgi:hypothetical protein
MFVSGILLLLAEPLRCYTTLSFRLKAVMLILAGLNVWYVDSNGSVWPNGMKALLCLGALKWWAPFIAAMVRYHDCRRMEGLFWMWDDF